jgi:hypothetical protein
MVNLDDLLTNRPGGVIRGKGVYGTDIMPIQVPFVFPQAVEAMGFMEQVNEGRTGVNRYFQGTDQNQMNKTATGVQQLSTMAAQRVQQIARNFSNGIEALCSALHEIVLKSGHKQDIIKLLGKWVQVDPSTWKSRTDFRISVGYASGNKDAMVSKLMLIAQLQEKAMAGGLPIVNARNVYETAIELTKVSDFATPERFWQDPTQAPPPSPPQPDVTIMAAEKLKSDTALQTKQIDAQSSLAAKQMDVEQKERDSQRDFELGKYKLETETRLSAAQALAQAEHATGLETHKASLAMHNKQTEEATKNQKTDSMAQMMKMIADSQAQQTQAILAAIQAMSAPKRIVRDANGRVSHTEPMLQ